MAAAKPTKTAPKGKEPKRLKLNQAWATLLDQNEKCPKGDRKSDAELVKEMQRLFPAKAERTTITRPTMIRAIYNKGTNMFAAFGPAKPLSRRYDEDGAVIEGRVVVPKAEKPKAKSAVKVKAKVKVRVKAKAAKAGAKKEFTYVAPDDEG